MASKIMSAAPIDMLRELRRVFVHDAAEARKKAKLSLSAFEAQTLGAQAYACENVVRKIDATLKDWA